MKKAILLSLIHTFEAEADADSDASTVGAHVKRMKQE